MLCYADYVCRYSIALLAHIPFPNSPFLDIFHIEQTPTIPWTQLGYSCPFFLLLASCCFPLRSLSFCLAIIIISPLCSLSSFLCLFQLFQRGRRRASQTYFRYFNGIIIQSRGFLPWLLVSSVLITFTSDIPFYHALSI